MRPPLARPSLLRTAYSGIGAASAYLLAQAVDMRLTGNRYDDRILWGGLISADPKRQQLAGLAVHYGVGLGLAGLYQMLRPALPRLPGWLQALAFVETENALSFPTVALVANTHPAVRRGQLPPLWTWRYFWMETARHAAYGLALGLLSGPYPSHGGVQRRLFRRA